MNTPEIADVLIIGAGAAGGVAARRLVDAGLTVVALEQGDWTDPNQYRGASWDWELSAQGPWASNPNVRKLPQDYPVDETEADMGIINFNGVGGSTILYSANWHRLTPADFRRRSEFGVADDWPIGYGDLESFYDRTDRDIGVSGLAGDPFYAPTGEFPLPPFNMKSGTLAVARALAKKGMHWWPGSNAILTAPYDGRRGCILRGACQTGCNEGAKSSFDITHWKRVVAGGGVLLTGARVRRILIDPKGLAAGAEWIDRDGGLHVQRARMVLCAASAVGTARLLLASASEAFPTGLANRSDQVGRRLMLHPVSKVLGVFPEPLESWEGPFGADINCMQYGRMDPKLGFIGPSKWSLHHAGDGPMGEALRVIAEQGPGGEHHARFAERFGHIQRWVVMIEDLPLETNRVVLSPDLTDSSGMPAVKLLYRFTDDVRKALAFNAEGAKQALLDAGATHTETSPGRAAHMLGTARMGDDPATSVVDSWCMSHDVPNLGIIDGSVFVTASCVNPTSTIAALALRTAERLIETRASWPTPGAPVVGEHPPGRAIPRQATPPTQFSPLERERLRGLADVLIPGGEGMPSASAAGVADQGLDRVLLARPDLAPNLRTVLAQPAHDPLAFLKDFAARAPGDFRNFLIVVSGAYYTDPAIKAAIGYAGQPETPHRPERVPAYITEGLLDHMLKG